MKLQTIFVGLALALCLSIGNTQLNGAATHASVKAQVPLVIDGDITDFTVNYDPIAVSGANGARDDIPPIPPEQEDFGADGTITELYVQYQDGQLFFAIRGDMFGGDETNAGNGTLILLDVDPGAGTGAKDMDDGLDGFGDDGDPSDLNDVSDQTLPDAMKRRSMISDAGTNLSAELIEAGTGWDAAFAISSPDVGGFFSWGSAGLPGTTSNFAELEGAFAYDTVVRPFGPGRGKPGTVYGAPNGFEASIAVSQLRLGSGTHRIRLVAITTSKTGYPSPNNLPESTDLSNAGHGTMVIDRVANITITVP